MFTDIRNPEWAEGMTAETWLDHFWLEPDGTCRYCQRETERTMQGHDGVCPVPLLARAVEIIDGKEFWTEFVYPEGMTADDVKKELIDYAWLMEAASKVYDHVTGGQISKPNTLPYAVMDAADDHYRQAMKEEIAEFERMGGDLEDMPIPEVEEVDEFDALLAFARVAWDVRPSSIEHASDWHAITEAFKEMPVLLQAEVGNPEAEGDIDEENEMDALDKDREFHESDPFFEESHPFFEGEGLGLGLDRGPDDDEEGGEDFE